MTTSDAISTSCAVLAVWMAIAAAALPVRADTTLDAATGAGPAPSALQTVAQPSPQATGIGFARPAAAKAEAAGVGVGLPPPAADLDPSGVIGQPAAAGAASVTAPAATGIGP
jgi:hypothetical protein